MASRILFIVYDNESKISFFPLAQSYLAGALEKAGHEVEMWQQDFHHWPDEKITEYLDEKHFDMVGISVAGGYYQYARLKGLCKGVNASKNRPFLAVGGHMCTPAPEYFINNFGIDAIALGEGENTVVDLVKALEDKTSLEDVKGIAFKRSSCPTFYSGVKSEHFKKSLSLLEDYTGDEIVSNCRQPLVQDLDEIPWPSYHLFPIEYYRLRGGGGGALAGADKNAFALPMITSRGCTFQCAFCYRLDKGFRERSTESVIEEMKFLYKTYNITYILFDDELTMNNTKKTMQFSNDFIKAGVGTSKLPVKWGCNGRLNFVTKELVETMQKAGCVFINYGVESYDNKVLKLMRKACTTKVIDRAVQATLDAGIHPGLNMLWNNEGDTAETLQKNVDFLLKYDDFAQVRTIRPTTPYPGSPLFHTAIRLGLLDKENPVFDFYEKKHINSDLFCVNFTDMTEEDAYAALCDANRILLKNYHAAQWDKVEEDLHRVYVEKDPTFRGFRLV